MLSNTRFRGNGETIYNGFMRRSTSESKRHFGHVQKRKQLDVSQGIFDNCNISVAKYV